MAEKENGKQAVKKEDKEKKTQVKETKKKMEKVRKEKPAKVEKKKVAKPAEKKEVGAPKNEKKTSLRIMHLRPLITEKAVMMIEAQNVLTFETTMNENKKEIKNEVEEIFSVKVENVRTLIRNGKKYAYVKLNPKDLAIDIATKLGMI